MDLGTGILFGSSALGGCGIIIKIASIKLNSKHYVEQNVYDAEQETQRVELAGFKELMENGFKDVGRRLHLIEKKM